MVSNSIKNAALLFTQSVYLFRFCRIAQFREKRIEYFEGFPYSLRHPTAPKARSRVPPGRTLFVDKRGNRTNTPEFRTARRGDKIFPSFAGIELSGPTMFLARTVVGGAVPGLMSLRWSWSY
jgi:hypothetical protein